MISSHMFAGDVESSAGCLALNHIMPRLSAVGTKCVRAAIHVEVLSGPRGQIARSEIGVSNKCERGGTEFDSLLGSIRFFRTHREAGVV